jgi:hypothetical protein
MAAEQPQAKLSGLSLTPEEADRLAAQFKPSWEIDDAETPAEAAPPALAKAEGDEAPVEGVPIAAVGEGKDPGEPVVPAHASGTRLGLGDEPKKQDAPAVETTVEADANAAPEVREVAAVAAVAAVAETKAEGVEAAPAGLHPVAPTQPERTQPDPEKAVELPVSAPPKGIVVKVAAALLGLAGIALVAKGLLGGSEKDQPARTPVATTTAAAPVRPPPVKTAESAPAAAPEPPKTAAVAEPPPPPPPVKTAEPAPEPPKTAAAAAPPPPAKTAEPVVKAAPSKPAPTAATTPKAAPSKPKPPKPPAPPAPTGGTKSGGGIIRETPF